MSEVPCCSHYPWGQGARKGQLGGGRPRAVVVGDGTEPRWRNGVVVGTGSHGKAKGLEGSAVSSRNWGCPPEPEGGSGKSSVESRDGYHKAARESRGDREQQVGLGTSGRDTQDTEGGRRGALLLFQSSTQIYIHPFRGRAGDSGC